MTRARAGMHTSLTGQASPHTADRLTVEQCRELLPPGFEVGDDELERMRDHLYKLAEAMLDAGGHLLQG